MGINFWVPILLYQSQVVAKKSLIKRCPKDSVKLRSPMAYQLRFGLSHYWDYLNEPFIMARLNPLLTEFCIEVLHRRLGLCFRIFGLEFFWGPIMVGGLPRTKLKGSCLFNSFRKHFQVGTWALWKLGLRWDKDDLTFLGLSVWLICCMLFASMLFWC